MRQEVAVELDDRCVGTVAIGVYRLLCPHCSTAHALLRTDDNGVTCHGLSSDAERQLLGKIAALTMRGHSSAEALQTAAPEMGFVLEQVPDWPK